MYPTRTDIIEGLERVRKGVKKAQPYRMGGLCGYMGHLCDCKYGATLEGEQTGCPEVMVAAGVLRFMTDEEYAAITRRGYDHVAKVLAEKVLAAGSTAEVK
jgi:hypothetical protein